MGNGYPTRQPDPLSQLAADFKGLANRVKVLENPTGTQTAEALKQLTQLVDNLATEIANVASSGATWTGPVADPTTAGISTQGVVSGLGSYNLDVSGLAGTRRTMWIHQSGAMGYAPSTREKKANIRPYDGSAAAFLACKAQLFEYIAQVDIRDNPANPDYDPNYVVPTDVGLLAEDLIANGLGRFVFYGDDGITVAGIDYITYTVVGFAVVSEDHAARIAALEAKA